MCGDKLSINSCLQYLKYYIKKNQKKNQTKTTSPPKKKIRIITHIQNNAINKTKQKQKPQKTPQAKTKKKQKKTAKKITKPQNQKHNTKQSKTCNHRFLSLYTFKWLSFEIVLSGRNYCVVLHNIFLNEMRSFVSVKLSMQLICFLFTSASTFL